MDSLMEVDGPHFYDYRFFRRMIGASYFRELKWREAQGKPTTPKPLRILMPSVGPA